MFCDVYKELYNSSGSEEAHEEIKSKINDLIEGCESGKIPGDVVKDAACKIEPDKWDVSEGYTSDSILNAPDSFFDMLASVYRSWLVHGSVTLTLLSCFFLPLLKSFLKNPEEINS